MAVIFVDSNASGANDGTSWGDAYTSILSAATNAASGDEVRVASDHLETFTSNTVITWIGVSGVDPQSLVSVISTNKMTGVGEAGAKLTTADGSNDIHWEGFVYAWGLHLESDDELVLGGKNSSTLGSDTIVIEECTLVGRGGSGNADCGFGVAARITAINCTFDFGAVRTVTVSDDVHVHIIGGDFTIVNNGPLLTWAANSNAGSDTKETGSIECEGVNFINTAASLLDVQRGGSSEEGSYFATFRRCNIPGLDATSSLYETTTRHRTWISVENCADGTISTPPLGLTRWESDNGEIRTVLSERRTGGADDGEQANPYSWKMEGNADTNFAHTIEGAQIARWVAGGSQITITLHLATDAEITDQEFHARLLGPDDSAMPTARQKYLSTRPLPNAAGVNLTDDMASTWNGTGVGVPKKIEFTYTPQVSGVVTVVPILAGNRTVLVDPKLEVA